uniref:C2H2-type domain-containing protein n=1 Tax=Euplotes harpa TaxID=151035 RepID=A0A7S3JMA2_9SPIT|mmetsp:Transcript_5556/g.6577  ORF Transcript_5556/g.6577 Transcript_5556/m.6577 type:complete len:110 (+) Transcript_5556:25-354(+)
MGTVQRRRGNTAKNKQYRKARATKNYTRDIDQVVDDLQPGKKEKLQNQPIDEDLPGMGQFYCIECARYLISEQAFATHLKTKEHKKRLKRTKEVPYSQKEADRVAGLQS